MPRGTRRQAQGAPPSGRPGLLGPRRRRQGRRGHAAGSRAGSVSARGTAARPRGSGSACGAAARPAEQRLWVGSQPEKAAELRLLCRGRRQERHGRGPGRRTELPYAAERAPSGMKPAPACRAMYAGRGRLGGAFLYLRGRQATCRRPTDLPQNMAPYLSRVSMVYSGAKRAVDLKNWC